MQLSKEIGITQKSAWFLLHRLRKVCDVRAIRLSGIVEADEIDIGGKQKNRHDSKPRMPTGGNGVQAVIEMRKRGRRTKAKPIANTDRDTIDRTDDLLRQSVGRRLTYAYLAQ